MAKILLVDDEDRFRTSLAGRLRKRGLDVLDVSNGEDAVRTTRPGEAIGVAGIAPQMPGMGGIPTPRGPKPRGAWSVP